MDESPLTPRQAEILETIRDHIAEHGRPPSRPELARMLGGQSDAARKHAQEMLSMVR